MEIFERRESAVRSYSRAFPTTFATARGSYLYNTEGRRYVDFFSGAGAVNYGHNNPQLKRAIIRYLEEDGVTHSLDMATAAKARFLEKFESLILEPRGLDYKVQFTGPTGANAIEAALKIARKAKRRSNIVTFTNGYHGLSSGALSITGGGNYRNDHYVNRQNVSFIPFDGYFGPNINTVDMLRKLLEDRTSGLDLPAAVVLETIQAEGGVNVARASWLQELEQLCRQHDILLIVDDIQVGTGRTGRFFSFEEAGIRPDIVTLSKSIGGYGLPMSLVLLQPEVDQWNPGEHTGTFRGNNLAFVAAAEALTAYWETDSFAQSVRQKGEIMDEALRAMQAEHPALQAEVRGKGLIYGLEIADPQLCNAIAREAFQQGLVIESCGSRGNVLKFLPPLVVEEEVLAEGLRIMNESIVAQMELA